MQGPLASTWHGTETASEIMLALSPRQAKAAAPITPTHTKDYLANPMPAQIPTISSSHSRLGAEVATLCAVSRSLVDAECS
mmetsp:Transcript_61979/g.156487  ORF Transcript_61979/g.156487 Transcript_61979/m.156487 type:complete len:81 (-) Transcript_61979:532-774(-)